MALDAGLWQKPSDIPSAGKTKKYDPKTASVGEILATNLRRATGKTISAAPGLAAATMVPPVGGIPLGMGRAATLAFGGEALAQDARKALGMAEPHPGVSGPLMSAGIQAASIPVGAGASRAVGAVARPLMTSALKVPGMAKIVGDFGDVVGEALRSRIPVSATPGTGKSATEALMSSVSAELRPLLRSATKAGARIPTDEVMAAVDDAIENLRFMQSKGAANVDADLEALNAMRSNFTSMRTRLVDEHGNPLSIPRHKGGVMDPLQAQRFKRGLQRLAQRAYDRASRGINSEVMDAADQFNQKAAEGVRRGIERVVPQSAPLNSRLQRLIGLQRALGRAEPTAAAIPPPNFNPATWLPGLNMAMRPTTMSNMALGASSPTVQAAFSGIPRAGAALGGQMASQAPYSSREEQISALQSKLASAISAGRQDEVAFIQYALNALGAGR